jgi:hypothetical protein
MGNWALCQPHQVRRADGNPFLDRLKVVQTPWFGIYVHLIDGPDPDPDPHDHPWPFLSVVLSGMYVEMLWPDSRQLRYCRERLHRRFRPRVMRRRGAHRILSTHGLVWTLCVVGRNHGEWGFWTSDGPVAWRSYLATRQTSGYAPGSHRPGPYDAQWDGPLGGQRPGPIARMFLPPEHRQEGGPVIRDYRPRVGDPEGHLVIGAAGRPLPGLCHCAKAEAHPS